MQQVVDFTSQLRFPKLNDIHFLISSENMERNISIAHACSDHRYLIYTRWCIAHRGQAKIEARSQALVVPTDLTRSMIICVFCIAEMDKV